MLFEPKPLKSFQMPTHTILGANGNIAKVVAKELHQKGITIRQFSRNPNKVNADDELFPGDLLESKSVADAVKGAEVVYLLAGIKYRTAIWQRDWPIVMRNTLDACIQHGAKLVFFDNMYACDPHHIGHLTEETPLNPTSKKGLIRKQILDMLWKEVKAGKLEALVARAADFYGPGANNSFLNELVIKRMKDGKRGQCLYSSTKRHSFTYIPDAGKATAFLGLQKDAWNQTWNLPTESSYSSLEEIAGILNQQLDTKHKLQVMSPFLVSLFGTFIPELKEVKELRYQLDSDYRLDSSKIEKAYGLKATPIEEGLKASI